MKFKLSKKSLFLSRFLIAFSIIYFAYACNNSSYSPTNPNPTTTVSSIKIDSSSATLGKRLTDGSGYALYFFAKDLSGASSACSGGCSAVWPPFLATANDLANLPAGLDKNDFSTTADGKQTTYKKWPLYRYTPSGYGNVEKPGDANGDGVEKIWMVAKPNYSVALVDTVLTPGGDQRFLISKGMTLYFNNMDDISKGTSTDGIACKGGCLSFWPIVNAQDALVLPSLLNKADFGSFTRTDITGSPKQMTYKGHLVYTFAPDKNRGSVKGQGVGNQWYVINP